MFSLFLDLVRILGLYIQNLVTSKVCRLETYLWFYSFFLLIYILVINKPFKSCGLSYHGNIICLWLLLCILQLEVYFVQNLWASSLEVPCLEVSFVHDSFFISVSKGATVKIERGLYYFELNGLDSLNWGVYFVCLLTNYAWKYFEM